MHVTRLDGGKGRIEGDVVHHEGLWLEEEVGTVAGERVLRPERCVLEAASRVSNETALGLFDAGLRLRKYDAAQLHACHDLLQFRPFMRHLQIPVRMADGRSGSIGESRGRWLFYILGFPAPDLQLEVRDPAGELAGICDWAWVRHGLLGEFDGRVKYGRLLRPGQDAGDVVFEEKRREDRLREITGLPMVRLVWSDYDHPHLVAERLARFLPRHRSC